MKYKQAPMTGDFQPKIEFENGAIIPDELFMDIRHVMLTEGLTDLDKILDNENFNKEAFTDIMKDAIKSYLSLQ